MRPVPHLYPLRIGPSDRQLLALHHPPSGPPRDAGVVLCSPFGIEAIRSHRVFRVLGEQLARRGFHVLRFDYFGTGDSAGEDHDGDLDGWCQDLLTADQELRRHSGCTRISWLGLRLGASIAALASKQCTALLDQLFLWDPVISGKDYLKELEEAHFSAYRASFGERWSFDHGLRARASAEAAQESVGFALSSRLRSQIQQVSAASLASALARRVVFLGNPELASFNALNDQMRSLGTPLSPIELKTDANWTSIEAMDTSIAPSEVLTTVVGELKEE